MAKTVVVVSTIVDTIIKEQQKDVTFFIFKSLEELDQYITRTPIRAQTLYFSRDVIPLTNTSLNYLVSLLDKVFFKVDEVVYITEKGSDEIESVKFLINTKEYKNWEIIQGQLNREFVTGVVNGSARTDISQSKRKAVFRVPKSEYVREKTRQTELIEGEAYVDDDEAIQEMPDEKMPVYLPPEREHICQCYDIVGIPSDERTMFVFIMSQYLATHGKTLIVERDWEYHKLGEMTTKSGVDFESVTVEELFHNANVVFQKIRDTRHKLIIVLASSRKEYNYSFVFNLLYNNLEDALSYIIREDDFGEEPTESKFTVVTSNKMYDILHTCSKINMNFIRHLKFVTITQSNMLDMRLPNSLVVDMIIRDVLNSEDIPPSELLSINSLKLGLEDGYDLRSVMWN